MAVQDWPPSLLKEFVERVITEHDRRYELRFTELARALELQAREYERRLADLNHAHAEAVRVLATYLPRELYERANSELVEWQRKADIKFVEFESRVKKTELGLVDLPGGVKSLELGLASQSAQALGSRMTMTSVVGLIGTAVVVVGGLIGLLNYFGK